MKRRTVLPQIVILFTLVVTPCLAQILPQLQTAEMPWRLVGPFRAGRALAAAGIPGDPYTFFFGSVDGGMWKTVNAGLTWESISDGTKMNPSVGAFAIAPSNSETIYVGTGEADMRSDITYGSGVYKTTDGGTTWQHCGLEETQHIGKVLVDPHNPDIVLVAALGHAYGPNEERGVFRSTDGGKRWKKVLYKNPDVGAIDLAWDESDPSVVYASLWQARRTPWSQYPPDEGPGSGLYKSTDEGTTWNEIVSSGLPAKPYGRIGLTVAAGSHGKIVYALIEAQKKGSGLYRSDDGGQNWHLAGDDPRIVSRMWYFGQVSVDPKNPDVVYIPDVALMRSTDGGKSFTAIKGAPGGDDYHFLWIDPTNDNRMIVATDQGTVISVDGGKTWSSWYNEPTAQFYHVITDNEFPYRIYGAQQDAGTVSITTRSDYGLITFRDWYSLGTGESGYIAPDPQDPDIVYGGSTYGGVIRFDRTTGQTQNISPTPLSEFGTPAPQRKYRFTWTSPIVFDPHDAHTLYLGAQVLLKSGDSGLHWQEISPDITAAGEGEKSRTQSDSSHISWGVIYSIAPSPVQSGLMWVGTDDGRIQLTRDSGRHWENVTPNGLAVWSKIGIIEASPFDAGEAYAAVDRHRLDDFTPYIYRTRDYGKHWEHADNGIDSKAYVNVVRSDRTRRGLLYAGTETGVYVSFDDGNHWQQLQFNLPISSVRDLAVHDNDLIAATHGRAFWVLDDITPLQQMSEKNLNSEAHLFTPERAVRIRRSENSDTPLPPEIPHGTNPPSGAILDYYLRSTPREPITLEIFDNAGNLVRKFSSADAPIIDTQKVPIADYWSPQPESLKASAGLHRFVWDLHYPPPPVSRYSYSMHVANLRTSREPEGPLVLPGKYEVKLTVDGHSYSSPLEIEMDPRVKISAEVLRNQLSLAVNVWNTIAEAQSLSAILNNLKNQSGKLQNETKLDEQTRSLLSKFKTKISSLSDSLNVGGLSGLEGNIMGADREPPSQVVEAYEALKMKISAAQQRWKKLKTNDLASLNRALKERGVEELNMAAEEVQHRSVPAK
ncbi:MAG: hypothetical protein KGJ59_04620 [Bacteroidota bacterium]|nr:hypothetical protein [Bacteroidota bacterium]